MSMNEQHPFRHKKRNPLHFQIGLAVSLGLTLIAFEWQTTDYVPSALSSPDIDTYEEEVEHIRIKMKTKKKLQPRKPNPHKVTKEPLADPSPEEENQVEPFEEIDPSDFDSLLVEEGEITEHLPAIYEFPEVYPEFPGGEAALFAFLKNNIRFPKAALQEGKGGKIYVEFVIDRTGKVIQVKALNFLGYGLEQEAERVVKLLPKWIPGKQGPRNVSVRMKIPIGFSPR